MADLLSYDEVRAIDAERARGAARAHLLDEMRGIAAQRRTPALARLGDWLIALGSYLRARYGSALAAEAAFTSPSPRRHSSAP